MTKAEKEAWLKEAKMQMQAIATLEKYNMASLDPLPRPVSVLPCAILQLQRPIGILCSSCAA